jgi:hypothetical protein
VGRPFIHGKMFHAWEDFLDMGSLPIDGKVSQIWEDFMGSLPVHGKTSHQLEILP